MKKHLFILLVFSSLVFTSCSDFQEVNFSAIENVNVTDLSQKGVEAIVTARIKNPNSMGFNIYKSEMDVTIGGMNAGKAQLDDNVWVKSKSEETYKFIVKSDFSNLSITDMSKLMVMAMSKHVKVGIKGDLKVGKWFYKRSIPVDITKDVPLDGM